MTEDWRSGWAGLTTLTVADFILLTFDENPETVERQPDSRKRTTQILNAIDSGRLDSSFGYGMPAHRLLRPLPGIKQDQACLEHPANRMLQLSDALKFAVEVGKWKIPAWLHSVYLESHPQSNASHTTANELAQAKARIVELEAELERLKSMSQDVSVRKELGSSATAEAGFREARVESRTECYALREELAAEVERLRAENAALRTAGQSGPASISSPHINSPTMRRIVQAVEQYPAWREAQRQEPNLKAVLGWQDVQQKGKGNASRVAHVAHHVIAEHFGLKD